MHIEGGAKREQEEGSVSDKHKRTSMGRCGDERQVEWRIERDDGVVRRE